MKKIMLQHISYLIKLIQRIQVSEAADELPVGSGQWAVGLEFGAAFEILRKCGVDAVLATPHLLHHSFAEHTVQI